VSRQIILLSRQIFLLSRLLFFVSRQATTNRNKTFDVHVCLQRRAAEVADHWKSEAESVIVVLRELPTVVREG